jgi:DNA-directed RNA polymerase subunit RPC12/RpoP
MEYEPYPYIVCPECEYQMLDPVIEEAMFHFICPHCGCSVWVEPD